MAAIFSSYSMNVKINSHIVSFPSMMVKAEKKKNPQMNYDSL